MRFYKPIVSLIRILFYVLFILMNYPIHINNKNRIVHFVFSGIAISIK